MSEPSPLARRLLWFVALWIGSVAALGLVAWVLRSVLLP
ncbi:MAG TPA: DUF2474 family protein [Steroidobacteraceae bacterium]|jgi:hypothetical protein|nr:DUF2474 family protein [Steroidobacteraceae bacterium]